MAQNERQLLCLYIRQKIVETEKKAGEIFLKLSRRDEFLTRLLSGWKGSGRNVVQTEVFCQLFRNLCQNLFGKQ